jgi:hypothetical protein
MVVGPWDDLVSPPVAKVPSFRNRAIVKRQIVDDDDDDVNVEGVLEMETYASNSETEDNDDDNTDDDYVSD